MTKHTFQTPWRRSKTRTRYHSCFLGTPFDSLKRNSGTPPPVKQYQNTANDNFLLLLRRPPPHQRSFWPFKAPLPGCSIKKLLRASIFSSTSHYVLNNNSNNDNRISSNMYIQEPVIGSSYIAFSRLSKDIFFLSHFCMILHPNNPRSSARSVVLPVCWTPRV